jgi:sarcosine oxidase
MPGAKGKMIGYQKCFYTMTPDEHFIVDYIPGSKRCLFGAGFSGHGFKFMPVIGQALSDLAVDGKTELSIDFLSMRRF